MYSSIGAESPEMKEIEEKDLGDGILGSNNEKILYFAGGGYDTNPPRDPSKQRGAQNTDVKDLDLTEAQAYTNLVAVPRVVTSVKRVSFVNPY